MKLQTKIISRIRRSKSVPAQEMDSKKQAETDPVGSKKERVDTKQSTPQAILDKQQKQKQNSVKKQNGSHFKKNNARNGDKKRSASQSCSE